MARRNRRGKASIFLPPGRWAGRSLAVTNRPWPSNTTIGRQSVLLNTGIAAKRVGVDALLMAGGAHRQPKPDDVGHAVRDLSAVARIDETGREPPLDRGPRQCAAVPR